VTSTDASAPGCWTWSPAGPGSFQTVGHRGRKGDPLYGIRTLLRAGAEKLTDRQWTRFATAVAAHEDHLQVSLAWSCAQQLRSAYRHPDPAEGKRIAERVVASFRAARSPRSRG